MRSSCAGGLARQKRKDCPERHSTEPATDLSFAASHRDIRADHMTSQSERVAVNQRIQIGASKEGRLKLTACHVIGFGLHA